MYDVGLIPATDTGQPQTYESCLVLLARLLGVLKLSLAVAVSRDDLDRLITSVPEDGLTLALGPAALSVLDGDLPVANGVGDVTTGILRIALGSVILEGVFREGQLCMAIGRATNIAELAGRFGLGDSDLESLLRAGSIEAQSVRAAQKNNTRVMPCPSCTPPWCTQTQSCRCCQS